jgi:hypothetical protein
MGCQARPPRGRRSAARRWPRRLHCCNSMLASRAPQAIRVSRTLHRDLHCSARFGVAGVDHSPDSRRRSTVVDTTAPQQVELGVRGQALPRSSSNRELKSDEKSQRCVPALFAAIVDERQCNAYCKAMPSVRRVRSSTVDARADTDANCASHRCSAARRQIARRRQCDARGAGVGVVGAVWRLVRPVWRRQVARHRVGVFRAASRRSSAGDPHARRWARAVIAAHVLDDRFGRRRRLGRAVVRRSAPDARAGVARQHVALHSDVRKRHCRTSSMRAPSTRARWSIRSLICSPRTAPELEKERDACVAGALHTLTLLAGMPDIMLPAAA